MALLPVLTLALKVFAPFWALLTWAVAAAVIGRLKDDWGYYGYSANFPSANALLACGLIAWLYLLVSLFFLFRFPDHIFISVLVDTVAYGFFFIFALGSTAALSRFASDFSGCGSSFCSLASAAIGLGWVFTFLLLGILLLEVIYTLVHYGGSLATWKTPFAQLLQYGTKTSTGVSQGGDVPAPVAMGSVQPSQPTAAYPTQMQQSNTYAPASAPAPAPASVEQQGYAQSTQGSIRALPATPTQQGYTAQQTGPTA